MEKHKIPVSSQRVCFMGRQIEQTDVKISSSSDNSLEESKLGDLGRMQGLEGLVGSPREALRK